MAVVVTGVSLSLSFVLLVLLVLGLALAPALYSGEFAASSHHPYKTTQLYGNNFSSRELYHVECFWARFSVR